jgi:N,N'-diacetyllegionaminate synthase
LTRKNVTIGGTVIGDGQPTYVIAELGINHGGDMRAAHRLVTEAARAGANAIKLQTYRTEGRVPKDSPVFGVLKAAELSPAQQGELFAEARKLGVAAFSTPFDDESVAALAKLGVPAFKIASFDVVNLKLLRAVAAHRLPVVISRGMASREELDRAVSLLEGAGSPCVILHCVSAYPTPVEAANLRVIGALRLAYGWPVGYSDHTLGVQAAVAAVAAGAVAIEKHFTLDKRAPGPDHALSADPSDLREMVGEIRKVERMLGSDQFQANDAERPTLQYRRATA